MSKLESLAKKASEIAEQANKLSEQITSAAQTAALEQVAQPDPGIYLFTIFILACFVGYYVVWKVTPSLHTPLMSVTNAISGIIIVGALIALGPDEMGPAGIFGFFACMLAAINIFGGFVVTSRMLSMFKKK